MTVIHGTHRTIDLIPTFLAELDRLDGGSGQVSGGVMGDFPEYPGADADEADPFWDSEVASHMLARLFDELDSLAPPGTYFGAHPGDGSDFGFWPLEDEDLPF